MNYSIIFTEISFSPEISIVLQIIMNNSYDISDESRILALVSLIETNGICPFSALDALSHIYYSI